MSTPTDLPTHEGKPSTDANPKPTPPPASNGGQANEPVKLPDDHPLVTALAAQKAKNQALEEKARRLDEIEEAQKSEAEKAADALRRAQDEAQSAKSELLRYRTAAAHGITDAEDIELFLTGRDEETLTRQAKALAARTAASTSPRAPKPNPAQRGGDSPADDKDAQARAFFGIS